MMEEKKASPSSLLFLRAGLTQEILGMNLPYLYLVSDQSVFASCQMLSSSLIPEDPERQEDRTCPKRSDKSEFHKPAEQSVQTRINYICCYISAFE